MTRSKKKIGDLRNKIKMKTLVIHPKDSSTDFLCDIYSDKGWDVITSGLTKKLLKEQIKSHDRIIMLGHGTHDGLFGEGKFVIDSTYVYLLRDKDCVCIWCNADMFVEKYGLKGFYTGMIISEMEEAYMFGVNITQKELLESNNLFSKAIKESICNLDMVEKSKEIYSGESSIIHFNKEHIYQK